MKRHTYIVIMQNPVWRVGQYFIVDEDREYCVPAYPAKSGERGKFILESDSEIELLFDDTIKPYVQQIGGVHEEENKEDRDNDSIIFTG